MHIQAIPKKQKHSKEINGIKNTYLKQKLRILLKNWCVQKIDDEYLFYKHFESDRKGVINQLILSGNDYDGIYEFEIFGHDLELTNIYNKQLKEMIMQIKSKSNFDLASFEQNNTTIKLYKTQDDFWSNVRKIETKLSTIDTVIISTTNKDIKIRQQGMGEIKFKIKYKNLIKKHKDDIVSINFISKSKPLYISRDELSEQEFKNKLFDFGLITPEEYDLYAKSNKYVKASLYRGLKKIKII
ncbi:MAG: hypothetical protein ACOCP4_01080 [Candidatus Woesearchaeota archaeon]